MKSFGDRLKRLREAAGLSGRRFADVAGISPTTLVTAEGVFHRSELRRSTYRVIVQTLADQLKVSPEIIEWELNDFAGSIQFARDANQELRHVKATEEGEEAAVKFKRLLDALGAIDCISALISRGGISKEKLEQIRSGEIAPTRKIMNQVVEVTTSVLDDVAAEFEQYRLRLPNSEDDAIRPFVVRDAEPSRQDPHERADGIPLVSSTPAGGLVDFQPDIETDVFLPRALHDFPQHRPAALRVKGDSMTPTIHSGDVVVVATVGYRPQNDDILVVGFKQSAGHTMKRLRIVDEKTWELNPDNRNLRPTTVSVDDIAWHALVVKVVSDLWGRRETSPAPDRAAPLSSRPSLE
jgi:SOS-response transcriptional repressor LexA/transcriptional regulator with XRE-family HTH domain